MSADALSQKVGGRVARPYGEEQYKREVAVEFLQLIEGEEGKYFAWSEDEVHVFMAMVARGYLDGRASKPPQVHQAPTASA